MNNAISEKVFPEIIIVPVQKGTLDLQIWSHMNKNSHIPYGALLFDVIKY